MPLLAGRDWLLVVAARPARPGGGRQRCQSAGRRPLGRSAVARLAARRPPARRRTRTRAGATAAAG